MIGEYTKNINGVHFETVESINKYLRKRNIDNSIIYIKGSRKMNLDKIKIGPI